MKCLYFINPLAEVCVYVCVCIYIYTVQCDTQNAEVIQIHLLLGSPHLNSGFLQTIMAI